MRSAHSPVRCFRGTAFRRDGFTLIEIIAALALLGVLSAVFGMGLVAATRSFTFSRENVRVAQKGQLAMARVSRELMELIAIRRPSPEGESTSLIYERAGEAAQPAVGYALQYRDQSLWLYTGVNGTTLAGSGHLLCDGVARFDLDYFQGSDPWSFAVDPRLQLLSTIRITLELSRRDDPARTQQFSTLVHLRNTPNLGGAAPAGPAPAGYNYTCFIQSLDARPPDWRIPAVLLGMVIIAWRFFRKRRSVSRDGNALVMVVIAILIFSILAAAIIPMVSSSSQQVAVTDASSKALYLAESGFRLAASRFLHAGDSDEARHDALDALDGNYTLSGNDGRFELNLYSYFAELTEAADNETEVDVRFPGSIPDDLSISSGQYLRVGDQTVVVQNDPAEDDNVTMTVSPALDFYPHHTPVLPVAPALASTLSNGSDLPYASGQGGMFPLRNGQVRVETASASRVLTYRYNDRDNNTLRSVSDSRDSSTWNLTVPVNSPIVLMPFVQLISTGRAGSDDLQVDRRVVFNTPLPLSMDETERKRYEERFEDAAQGDSAIGTHEIAEIDGNNALAVTGTEGSEVKASLAEISIPSGTDIDLNRAGRATGGYLSYDTQVKVGFYENTMTPPSQGFFPPGSLIPSYFSAGPAFRVRRLAGDAFNLYGLGFTRGNNAEPYDGLPNGIIPAAINDRRAIVLWQQTNNGQEQTWLAYKLMSEYLVDFDFESGTAGWSASQTNGAWALLDNVAEAHSPSHYYRFHDNGNNTSTTGLLTYQQTILPDSDSIWLRFYSKFSTSADNNILTQVRISVNGASAYAIYDVPDWPPTAAYGQHHVNLTGFAGSRVQLQFYYQDWYDNYDQADWFIDDVRIEYNWPVQNSTLVVRLQEAAALTFANGGTAGSALEIQKGDYVIGAVSGARGRVAFSPVLSSGTWADGNAAGLLQLNRVTGIFQAEQIDVVGKGRCATVTSYDDSTERKVNFIKVYFARAEGADIGDTDRFNDVMHPNPRLDGNSTMTWPPDDDELWTAARDHFRLIEWDAINDANVTDLAFVPWRLDGISRNQAIIRSHQAELQTPDIDPAELLGLQALGDGAASVYFDDFGLQIDMPVKTPFPTPLQQ